MSILPSFLSEEISEKKSESNIIEIPKEYGVNFQTGQLTGKIVSGIDAIKVWIWMCLKTQRFRFPIYSWNYGADFEQYIGTSVSQEYIETDAQEEISAALRINPYIQEIEKFEADMSAGILKASFLVHTKFGDVEVIDGTVQ